jgi:hypothetical protein
LATSIVAAPPPVAPAVLALLLVLLLLPPPQPATPTRATRLAGRTAIKSRALIMFWPPWFL